MPTGAEIATPFATSNTHKDQQTVTPEGDPLSKRIHGVLIDQHPLHEDERGSLQEIYNPAWGLHSDPLVYAYCVITRPRQVRGWVVHSRQDDRLFVIRGVFRVALFDDRPESPTYKMLNVFVMSDHRRGLLVIPMGVFHALQNIGSDDACFINLPTRPYSHEDPDKYRLPLKNDHIPFAFDDSFVF